jgi:hypothetical protein
MSTAAASKNSSGGVGGWLILLVGIVLAYGAGAGGEGLSIGSGSGSRAGAGTAAASNPCPPNEDPHKVVDSFGLFGKYKLRCGDRGFGYKHMARRHGPITRDTLECIGKVLAHAALKPHKGNLRATYYFRSGDWARVVVNPQNGNIVTAYTQGSGARSARWSECVRA